MARRKGETPEFRFTVEGWVDDAGNRSYKPPSESERPHGLLVHATDKNDPERDLWLWTYNPYNFDMEDWDEIEDYVDTTIAESEEIY